MRPDMYRVSVFTSACATSNSVLVNPLNALMAKDENNNDKQTADRVNNDFMPHFSYWRFASPTVTDYSGEFQSVVEWHMNESRTVSIGNKVFTCQQKSQLKKSLPPSGGRLYLGPRASDD